MKALFLVCSMAFAQTPSFEVASVKPAGPWTPGQQFVRGGPGSNEPGRVTYTRATLRELITRAYDVWIDQVSGPEWLADSSKHVYTITATMPPDTTRAQFRLMLQNLLAERFQLRLHREQQTRPGYELVIADGGPKLKAWTPPKETLPFERGKTDGSGFAALDPNAAEQLTVVFPMEGGRAPVRISERGTIERFCRSLSGHLNTSLDRTSGPQARIVDRTGLTGVYDYRFEFTGTVHRSPAETRTDSAAMPVASDPGPTLFAAIEKQLGLKLVKAKEVAVDVLVVDHAERVPSENSARPAPR